MVDMDQGGVSRQWVRHDLGPSVGGTMVPLQNVLAITAPGTYTLTSDTNLVQVNVAGAVTIILPTAVLPAVPAISQPGLYGGGAITIVDAGSHADTFPITIQAAAGESIASFASVLLNTAFGGYTLTPSSPTRSWNVIVP
jgi:hypothetical protein